MAYYDPERDAALMPPQPTYSGGSAVQTATDESGHKWRYDDKGPGQDGAWVNLNSGEALTPSQFNQRAGRPVKAGANTTMLAQQMSGQPVDPVAPAAPVQGPTASPETVQRLSVLRPSPSTVTPPSQDSMDAYTLRMAQRYGTPLKDAMSAIDTQRRYIAQRGYQADLAAGMDSAQAMAKWGPLLFAGPKGMGSMPKMPISPGAKPNTYTDPKTGANYYQQGNRWMGVQHPAGAKAAPMDTIRETIPYKPAVEGSPAVPAVPKTRVLGVPIPFTGQEGRPAVQASLEQPSGVRTRHVPQAVEPPEPEAGPEPEAAAAPAPRSPFKEGDIIRHKGTKKRYKVVNGKPVPIPDNG